MDNKENIVISGIVGVYTALSGFVFIGFIYREDISLFMSLFTLCLIYAPIILSVRRNANIVHINISAIVGFSIGFSAASLMNDINIWPIALAFWLAMSLPIIGTIDLFYLLVKKKTKK